MCSKIIGSAEEKKQEELKHQAILLKGKAVFHRYQRKLVYLMGKKQSTMPKADEKKLVDDCFKSMEEAINLLGSALDDLYLDEEGSKLLDWAMMDCIRETNHLNQCRRCLLCRCGGVNLCKSHIFPKFILKSGFASFTSKQKDQTHDSDGDSGQQSDSGAKSFVFGKDKYQMKSAGECWLWLCCKRCEGIMTQNAENDFSQLFPSSGSVEYTSWLFNYCCTILFRTLSCVKFPCAFNDEEVYGAFLFCRKHLLSLPFKAKGVSIPLSDIEKYQLQLFSRTAPNNLEPCLLMTPSTVAFDRGEGDLEEITLYLTIPWLAAHRLIDGRLDLAGWSHFFVAYFDGISILLKFQPSVQCSLPSSCLVSPQKGTYIIPDESEAIKLIPKGMWMLYHRCALRASRDYTEFLQQVTPSAVKKMISRGLIHPLDEHNIFSKNQSQESTKQECRDTDTKLGLEMGANTDTSHDSVLSSESSHIKIKSDVPIVRFQSTNYKPRLSLLPPGFDIIIHPMLNMPPHSVELPQGHQIILHHMDQSHGLSVFLAVGNSGRFLPDQPYVIYHHLNKSERTYLDGSFITVIDGEICFSQFLHEHLINASIRTGLQNLSKSFSCKHALGERFLISRAIFAFSEMSTVHPRS